MLGGKFKWENSERKIQKRPNLNFAKMIFKSKNYFPRLLLIHFHNRQVSKFSCTSVQSKNNCVLIGHSICWSSLFIRMLSTTLRMEWQYYSGSVYLKKETWPSVLYSNSVTLLLYTVFFSWKKSFSYRAGLGLGPAAHKPWVLTFGFARSNPCQPKSQQLPF